MLVKAQGKGSVKHLRRGWLVGGVLALVALAFAQALAPKASGQAVTNQVFDPLGGRR